jgi:hypothetical protein
MEYGILTAESLETPNVIGDYQIIGPVDSIDEAREIAQSYLTHGPESDCLAPDRFVIHRRGPWEWYTIREIVNL